MSRKTPPKSFRLKEMKDWSSRGFYGAKPAKKLEQDFKIRKFVKSKVEVENLESIDIERLHGSSRIIISTSRPGIIIGRRGERVAALQKELGKIIPELKGFKLEVLAVKNAWVSAPLTAEWIATQIQKRVSYKRVLAQALGKIMRNREVRGGRIQIAGRLNGNEMSRTEWVKEGELKRQTIRSNIDYAFTEAYCTYGVIGIKVWVYKGEVL